MSIKVNPQKAQQQSSWGSCTTTLDLATAAAPCALYPVHTSFPLCARLHGATCARCFMLLSRCQICSQFLFVMLRCESRQECLKQMVWLRCWCAGFCYFYSAISLQTVTLWSDFTGICFICTFVDKFLLCCSSWSFFPFFPLLKFFFSFFVLNLNQMCKDWRC